MNLKEVLLAVETGTSETGHAEWLEVHIQSFKDCVGRWIDDSLYWQRKRWKARTWAKTWKRAAKEWRANAKWWEECFFDINAMLDTAKRETKEARAWPIRMKRERDDVRFAPNMALVRVAELEEERQAFADTCDMYYAQIEGLTQERDELQARVETLEALNQEHVEAAWKLIDEERESRAELDALKERRCEACVQWDAAWRDKSGWRACDRLGIEMRGSQYCSEWGAKP